MRLFNKTAVLAAVTSLIILTGCSSDNDEPAEDSPEMMPLSVGIIPIGTMSAIPYGIEQGIFEEHGLDVTISTGGGGAAMLPALQSGDLDVVIGNAANLLQAVEQGIDMRVISGYSSSRPEGLDVNGVVVDADSDIETWADLEGKSVAVNAVRGQGDVTIMESVAEDGGDPDAVSFVELAFPDMQAQMELGNVDAIWVPEPFLDTAVNDDGHRLLGHPNQIIPGLPTVVSFTDGATIEENAELVSRYQAAMSDLLEQFMADESGKIEATMEFIEAPEEVAKLSIERDVFDAEIPEDAIRSLDEIMLKYGFLTEDPITDEFFYHPAVQ